MPEEFSADNFLSFCFDLQYPDRIIERVAIFMPMTS